MLQPSNDESTVTIQRKMNTRQSTRLAATPSVVAIRSATSVPTPVKTRHSARMALRPRPNYYEPEEWEVEEPFYPSNPTIRTVNDLSVLGRVKYQLEVAQCNEILSHANDVTLPKFDRHRLLITFFWFCKNMEFSLQMEPKFRAVVRNKIQEFEEKLRGNYTTMAPCHRGELTVAMDAAKEVLANVHRSPYFIAA